MSNDKFCSYCGAKNPSDNRFCQNCGQSIDRGVQSQQETDSNIQYAPYQQTGVDDQRVSISGSYDAVPGAQTPYQQRKRGLPGFAKGLLAFIFFFIPFILFMIFFVFQDWFFFF
jgi:uncharacterized membrane protein YvbJ